MSSKAFYNSIIRNIYVQANASQMPAVNRIRGYLSERPIIEVESESDIPENDRNGRSLFLCMPKGKAVRRCPGSRGHLCCNYLTADVYEGCGIGCTYCILKQYLNFAPIRIVVDPRPSVAAIRDIAGLNPLQTIRVGTGETGDSLLYDPLTGLSEQFIQGLCDLDNVYFEMKTKTDFVDHLLTIKKKGNAVIGFSVNPEVVTGTEEGSAPPLSRRIDAARKAVEAGYLVSFHFDPIFHIEKWQEPYTDAAAVIGTLPSDRVAWISLGTFRYPPGLKAQMEQRSYLYDEFVPSKDGKYRYIQKIRVGMYRKMLKVLRSHTDAPVYLCMESAAVWKRVFGVLPGRNPGLESIFTTIRLP